MLPSLPALAAETVVCPLWPQMLWPQNAGRKIARRNCVHVGEDQLLGQVAPMRFFILLLDDGELVENVGRVVARQAVKVEE